VIFIVLCYLEPVTDMQRLYSFFCRYKPTKKNNTTLRKRMKLAQAAAVLNFTWEVLLSGLGLGREVFGLSFYVVFFTVCS